MKDRLASLVLSLDREIWVGCYPSRLSNASPTTLIKSADRISAYFEAVQLAGFSETEAGPIFGEPPPGIVLHLKPLPTGEAQARFLQRFATLGEATGLGAPNIAFSTE